mgnify:CR=1 FL=1
MYIYILKKFKDVHNKEIYKADTIVQVSASRYKEIIKNTNELKRKKKLNEDLVREATEEEIRTFLDTQPIEEENQTEDSVKPIEEENQTEDSVKPIEEEKSKY